MGTSSRGTQHIGLPTRRAARRAQAAIGAALAALLAGAAGSMAADASGTPDPAATGASDAAATLEPIAVTAAPTPRESRPYRDLMRALTVFERNRARAPAAELRFRVYPRHSAAVMQGLSLAVRGRNVHRDVALGEDGSFALARDPEALADDASVVSNRPDGSLAWRADIRTPGLPPHTRRLGDLRLECQVDAEGAGAGLATGLKTPAFRVLAATTDPCMVRGVHYGWFADEPVFAVRFVHAGRRQNIPGPYLWGSLVDGLPVPDSYWDWRDLLRDRFYSLPIQDTSWPDDTLVEFESMDAPIASGTAGP